VNALTIDVEDYFHVAAFSSQISISDWGKKYPSRVEMSTKLALELFAQHNCKATFFVLGWVAEKHPELIKQIVDEGHELACHGFMHQKANTQTVAEFREDVYRSKSLLEELSGTQIYGYRAPSFSIDPSNEWTFEVLKELGFTFSSSTYPVEHDHYGAPDWPRFKHLRPEGITELPIPTMQIAGKSVPIGGGGFFRLYPYWLTKHLISRFVSTQKQPYSFYFHPWELDPAQPRIHDAPFKSKFRHYLNLHSVDRKLSSLLKDFEWGTVSQAYGLDHNR
jgi:polysaccharide deacetylase family protein (PEP-CTERM system associated)